MSKGKKLTPAVPFHEQPINGLAAIDPPENQGGNKRAKAYRVLKGLTYHSNTARGEVGDIVTDLPADSIPWLLEQGCIQPVDEVK